MSTTLESAVNRTLKEAFHEAIERFKPAQSVLLLGKGSSELEVREYRGFAEKPTPQNEKVPFPWLVSCLERPDRVIFKEGNKSTLCAPIRRPPVGETLGAFYFDAGSQERGFQEEDVFAIEALVAKTGATVAMLWDRLICKNQRVLPTSAEEENWTGVRKAGLEAFREGVTDMALVFLKRAIETAEAWGPCPQLGTSLNDYGQVLRACDRLDEAAQEFERGLAVLEQAGMEQHHQRIPLLNNLAGVHHAKGNLSEAEVMYRNCLDILMGQSRESNMTAVVMANLGVVYKEMGDLSSARMWLEQALAASTRLYGEDHPNTQRCRTKLEELG